MHAFPRFLTTARALTFAEPGDERRGEPGTTSANLPPLGTLDEIAHQMTHGFWGGDAHHFDVTQGGSITVDLTALTDSGRQVARQALQLWSDVIGVDFDEVSSGAQITFDDLQVGTGAFSESEWTNGVTDWATVNVSLQRLNLHTYIHEIGHALGLGHTSNANSGTAAAVYPDDALWRNDGAAISTMSYFDNGENTYYADLGFTNNPVATPQVADIIAIGNLYGLSTTTRTGDTTYGFNNNSGRDVFDASLHPNFAYTIFDSGGIDTLDYSGFAANQLIDLNPEAFSNIGFSIGNVVIARGTTIENARGGSGSDEIVGNGAANALVGNGGGDLLRGGDGNDLLDGGAGDDSLFGDEGTDELVGGAGNDLLDGGEGYDQASYADAPRGVVVSLADASPQDTGHGIDTLAGFEALIGSNFDDVLIGDDDDKLYGLDGDDRLYGGGGTYERLLGGNGNDFLDGGEGRDSMQGEDGDDIYIVDSIDDVVIEIGSDGYDRVFASSNAFASHGEVERITLVGDANLTAAGNEFANDIFGNTGANVLAGAEGDDRLFGGAGNDTLNGGAGLDRMYGGIGNDIYRVSDATDYAYENAGEGTDKVESSISHSLRANVENLTLTGELSNYGKGNDLANILTGNSGSNKLYGYGEADRLIGGEGSDTLDGGAGLDKMFGGTGNDIYYTDSTSDQMVELAGEGIDTVKAAVTRALGANFERLYLTGTDDINGAGNGEANLMKGNSGANILRGGAGNDKLYAYDGADVVKGEDGNDWLEGGAGRDRFYGGSGADSFVFRDGDFSGTTSATADQIHDFGDAEGDRIRLSLADANSTTADVNEAFAWLGTGAFTGSAGELRYEQIGANTFVQGDTNGDGVADFWIRLDGLHTLGTDDFIF